MIFDSVSVYPVSPTLTKVRWTFLSPIELTAGPYTLYVEMSRSVTDNWDVVGTLESYDLSVLEFYDTTQRSWATNEVWFYRIRMNSSVSTYVSRAEPAWGSLDRKDRLTLREMNRQECLRLTKKVGSKGLLFKRKHWGVLPTMHEGASVVDFVTGEVLDVLSEGTSGTQFIGGYHAPISWWLELRAGEVRKTSRTEAAMEDETSVGATGLYYPIPRNADMWLDCTSGRRYWISSVTIKSKIKHVPVVVDLVLDEIPFTDIAYKVEAVDSDDSDLSIGGRFPSIKTVLWKDAWVLNLSYTVDNLVYIDGSTYICTANHVSNNDSKPTSGSQWQSYWALFAKGGRDGVDGTSGTHASGFAHNLLFLGGA